MKKLNLIFITIFLLTAISVFAQPKLTLHLTGGYGTPLGDFKTSLPPTSPVTSDNKVESDYLPYYTNKLINFGVDGKLAFGKKGNARAVLGVTYNMFSNNTNGIFKINANGDLAVTSFEPKVNVLSVYLGGEWAFIPNGKVNPFIGAGFAGNFFSGEFKWGQEVRIHDKQRTAPMDMKSETRIGILFDGGVDFMLSKQIGAVVGIKYHLINPIGKGADKPEEVGENEIDLGDEAHTEDGKTFDARSISSFNGYAGISFYFGAPKKKVVK